MSNEIAKNNPAKKKEIDLEFNDQDMMMIMMMVMMVAVMSQFLGPVVQASSAQVAALERQSFTGQEDPRIIHATSYLSWINLIYDYPYQPWISAYFINDGPGQVEIGINYPDDRFTMNPLETNTVTRSGAEERIKIIYFMCPPGQLSNLRVTGEY